MGNHDGPENIDPEIRGRDHGMLRTKMDQVKRQETTTRKFHTKGSKITPRPAVRGPRLWPSANSFFDALHVIEDRRRWQQGRRWLWSSRSSFFDALLAWRRPSADAGDGHGDRQQSADMRRACMEWITTGISGHTGGTILLSSG